MNTLFYHSHMIDPPRPAYTGPEKPREQRLPGPPVTLNPKITKPTRTSLEKLTSLPRDIRGQILEDWIVCAGGELTQPQGKKWPVLKLNCGENQIHKPLLPDPNFEFVCLWKQFSINAECFVRKSFEVKFSKLDCAHEHVDEEPYGARLHVAQFVVVNFSSYNGLWKKVFGAEYEFEMIAAKSLQWLPPRVKSTGRRTPQYFKLKRKRSHQRRSHRYRYVINIVMRLKRKSEMPTDLFPAHWDDEDSE